MAIVHNSNIRGINSATAGHASLRSINYTNSPIDRRRVIRLLYDTYKFPTRSDHQLTISVINQARVVSITHIRKNNNKTINRGLT